MRVIEIAFFSVLTHTEQLLFVIRLQKSKTQDMMGQHRGGQRERREK